MSGLLAIYAFDELWNLSNIVKYGLMALQHRGSHKIAVCVPSNGVKCFTSESIDEVSKYATTNIALAAITNGDREYVHIDSRDGEEVAVVTDRRWGREEELLNELFKALKSQRKRVDAFKHVLSLFNDCSTPTLAIITSNREIVVWRTPSGLTPLVLGSYGFDMAIASSESVAIDILGGDVKKFLRPGEGIYMSRYILETFALKPVNSCGLCLFELLYIARHDAVVDGVSVYEFRKALGRELAKYLDRDVDVVVGVPETAIPYAIGFAQEIKKPFELSFVSTGGRRRSMLLSDPFEKIVAIHLKMNPIRSVLEGKSVAVVDDSMVTGATMKTVSQILRFRVGAREIHLFIASPKLVAQCPYNVLSFDMRNLLAANLSHELAKSYLEVDSLHWLSNSDVEKVAKSFGLSICRKCFS